MLKDDEEFPGSLDELTKEETSVFEKAIQDFRQNRTYNSCPENIERESLAQDYGLFKVYKYRIDSKNDKIRGDINEI